MPIRRNYRGRKYPRKSRVFGLNRMRRGRGYKRDYYDGMLSKSLTQRTFSQTHSLILSDYDANFMVSDTTADVFKGVQWQLNALTGFADIQNLYDQYRIAKVELVFYSCSTSQMTTSVGSTGTALNFAPYFMYAVDTGDNTPVASFAELQEYGSCHTKQIQNNPNGKIGALVIYPKVREGVLEDGGTIVSGVTKRAPWISTGRADVPHYGIKLGLSSTGTGGFDSAWSISLSTRIYLQVKNNL